MMKYVYPAIFTALENGEYDVVVPDLPGCRTCGANLPDAISMAEDATSMWLWDAENNKESIPTPSPASSISVEDNQIVSLVMADTKAYREKYDSRAVKKTLTIPAWLNSRATAAGINFSAALQAGIKAELHID